MKSFFLLIAAVLCFSVVGVEQADAQVRLGGGIHYLKTVGDLADTEGFDDNSIGFMAASDRRLGSLFRFMGALEYIPDYGGIDDSWSPEAFLFIGNLIYGGAGIGISHIGDDWGDPFYMFRAGVDLALGTSLGLDAFASYRIETGKDLGQLGSDDLNAVTFGALLMFNLGGGN